MRMMRGIRRRRIIQPINPVWNEACGQHRGEPFCFVFFSLAIFNPHRHARSTQHTDAQACGDTLFVLEGASHRNACIRNAVECKGHACVRQCHALRRAIEGKWHAVCWHHPAMQFMWTACSTCGAYCRGWPCCKFQLRSPNTYTCECRQHPLTGAHRHCKIV